MWKQSDAFEPFVGVGDGIEPFVGVGDAFELLGGWSGYEPPAEGHNAFAPSARAVGGIATA